MADKPLREAKLKGASFRRLKLENGSLSGRAAADSFIDNLMRCKFISEAEIDGSYVYLYGDLETVITPSYAPFLRDIFGHDVADIPYIGYVLIMHRSNAWYALAFGSGHQRLADVLDTEAHREVAQYETMPKDPNHIVQLKEISVREPGATSILTQKRSNRGASPSEFGLDLYTSIFDNVLGSPKDVEKYGRAISGGEAITIRATISSTDFLSKVDDLEATLAEAQVEHEDGVPGIKEVKSSSILDQLNAKLVAMVRDEQEDDVWISIPHFLTSDIAPEVHFASSGNPKKFPDTVTIDDYRDLLRDAGKLEEVDLGFLRKAAMVIDDEKLRFPLIRCLGAHIELNDRTYIHNDRYWYEVPATNKEVIDQLLDIIELDDNLLPVPKKVMSERKYNESQNTGEWLMLDRENTVLLPREKPIEICDLMTVIDGRLAFVHVKRDFSSSQLSHLFNQGSISASMLFERAAREKYVEKIRKVARSRKGTAPRWVRNIDTYLGEKFSSSRISVVCAILGNWGKDVSLQRLPFFSKRTLVIAAQGLRGRDFRVSVAAINV